MQTNAYAVTTFLLILIVQANAAALTAAQELEVTILLNRREYSYSPAELIDGYFSINRPSRVELWVQYPDQSWNLWISVQKPGGTYKFGKNALDIPRYALSSGHNLLRFLIMAVDVEGNSATDSTVAWLKV